MPWDPYQNGRDVRRGRFHLPEQTHKTRIDTLGLDVVEDLAFRIGHAISQCNFERAHEIVDEGKRLAEAQGQRTKNNRNLRVGLLVFLDRDRRDAVAKVLQEYYGITYVHQLLKHDRTDLGVLFDDDVLGSLADAMRREGFVEWANSLMKEVGKQPTEENDHAE